MTTPNSDLIERYFANRCRPEEVEIVLAWLATREGQAFYDYYLRDRIAQQNILAYDQTTGNPEKLLAGVYKKIKEREGEPPVRLYRWHWIAAAVTLLAVSTWIMVHSIRPGQQIVETAYGETHRLVLDDGTTVVVNANSIVRYQAERPREIWLEGEAFFNVAHTHNDTPFRVHTSDMTVNVLGTEFNVNTRHQKTDVVLRNGKVQLALQSTNEADLMMRPGDKVSYAHQDNAFQKEVVDAEAYISWTSGILVFDHTPLREVFQWMEDTYGVTVEVTDQAILSKEFTGEVVQNQNVLLTLLEKSFGLSVAQQGNRIYLTKED